MSAPARTHCAMHKCALHNTASVRDIKDKEPWMEKQRLQQRHLQRLAPLERTPCGPPKAAASEICSPEESSTAIYRKTRINVPARHTTSSAADSSGHVDLRMPPKGELHIHSTPQMTSFNKPTTTLIFKTGHRSHSLQLC